MRLSADEVRIIRTTVDNALGTNARVYLFGSRVDDAARGGDVDLYVETDRPLSNTAAAASRLTAQLQLALGDQRIDVIVVDPNTVRQPIHDTARSSGVAL